MFWTLITEKKSINVKHTTLLDAKKLLKSDKKNTKLYHKLN